MEDILKKIIQFRDDRDWGKFHNPKDLAISISLEANELLENFQWKNNEEAIQKNIENIKDEIADVMIYSLLFADRIGINMEEAILNKLEKNNKKYPISKSFGSNKKYTEF